MKLKIFGKTIEIGDAAQSRTADISAAVPGRQRKLSPASAAAAFAGSTQDLQKVFAEIELYDAHVFAELTKRRQSAARREWTLLPPPDATKKELQQAKLTEELIRRSAGFAGMVYDLSDAIGKGFAAVEIEWVADGSLIRPAGYYFLPQTAVDFTPENGYRINKKGGGKDPLIPGKWIIHEFAALSGPPEKPPC